MTTLTFYGGAKSVTGANYLLEEQGPGKKKTRILIDCGMQQGVNYCDSENFSAFRYKPKSIDAVFVTHAHIDHTGRIPKLYKEGFRGTVYSTPPTKDFAEHLLLDSENIISRQAREQHCPDMYDIEDVNETLRLWKKIPYHQKIKIGGFTVEFFDAGHILGSSFIVVTTRARKRIVFSGDLGNSPAPLIKDTEQISKADYVLIESTYGGRTHETIRQQTTILQEIIANTIQKKGVLMIPAFAMERTQQLLYQINKLVEHKKIPPVPIYLDSPLAIKLTAIYKKYSENPLYFDNEAISQIRKGDAIFDFPGLKMTLTSQLSKEINDVKAPKIIIAGAGMMNGGRIVHHAIRYLSNPKNTLLFVGYQANGTLGREILQGAKTVRLFGEHVPVRCSVKALGGFSAHADQPKLIDWLRPMKGVKQIFLVQGEEEQMHPLADAIAQQLKKTAVIPSTGDQLLIEQ